MSKYIILTGGFMFFFGVVFAFTIEFVFGTIIAGGGAIILHNHYKENKGGLNDKTNRDNK